MNKLNITIMTLLFILTSCKSENNLKPDTVKFEKFEIVGNWIHSNKIEDPKNNQEKRVSKICLNDDFTADIVIRNSTNYKTLVGGWEINKEQKAGPFQLKSHIVLTFDWNATSREIMLISVEKQRNKINLAFKEQIFEKDKTFPTR